MSMRRNTMKRSRNAIVLQSHPKSVESVLLTAVIAAAKLGVLLTIAMVNGFPGVLVALEATSCSILILTESLYRIPIKLFGGIGVTVFVLTGVTVGRGFSPPHISWLIFHCVKMYT